MSLEIPWPVSSVLFQGGHKTLLVGLFFFSPDRNELS